MKWWNLTYHGGVGQPGPGLLQFFPPTANSKLGFNQETEKPSPKPLSFIFTISPRPAMGSYGYGFFRDVNDVALKPKLLRGVLSEKVLDAKRPFGKPSELVEKFKPIVNKVVLHRLLSESFPDSTDSELASSWKSAVDDWVERNLKLLASDVSDKSLAGVWLLGLTCRECSSERFLASCIAWLNELLAHIQSSSSSQRVKLASCASISDLLTRLAGFQTVKDGNLHAGKVIQPIVKLLNDDDAMAVWETAAHLLSTILHYFPSSVLRHYDSVESVVVSRMLAVNSSPKLLEKLTYCLALLPKIRGDEDLMLKRVLMSINNLLNDALEGLDEEKRQKAVTTLLQQGSSPSPLFGELSDKVARRSTQLLMHSVSTLMQCFCMMISGLYPVQVTIPVRSVLLTIERVLKVDGSVCPSLEPVTTTMQQEVVCAQLPMLHQCSLEVVLALVTGIDSQLFLYSADIARLLIDYLKKFTFPETRVQVYSIIKHLLVSMGGGMTLYLAEEVIRNASIDLNLNDCLGRDTSKVTLLASAEPILQHCNKKRKHGNSTILSEAQQNSNNLEVDVTKDCSKFIALKIAALQTLKALLMAGGALRSDVWRAKVDTLVFTAAMKACKSGWANDVKLKESKATWTDFQLAALDACLTSLLAPAHVRPAHFAQGLELFRDGSKLGGLKITEACASAISSLEPLLHPRALPLPDFSAPNMNDFSELNNRTYGSIHFGGPSSDHAAALMGISFPGANTDLLNDIYMEKDKDIQVPVSKSHEEALSVDEQQLQTSEDINVDKVLAPETAGIGDKMMIDSEVNRELLVGKQEDPVTREGITGFPPISGSSAAEMEPAKAALKDHSGDILHGTSSVPISEGQNRTLARADDNALKLSKDNPDDDALSDWSLSSVELDVGSDDEVDSGSD